MIGFLTKKLFGTKNERYLKSLRPLLAEVNGWESRLHEWPDEDFPRRIGELRDEVRQGRDLDSLVPEVFAITREAGRRVLGMRHFDVQILGGITLHQGKIAAMKTG